VKTISGDVDGAWYWIDEPDGVYVVVLAPIGKGHRPQESEVRSGLEAAGLKEVDELALARGVSRCRGEPELIAPAQEVPSRPGRVEVYVAPDESVAAVRVLPPAGGGEPATPAGAKEALARAGVTHGVDDRLVEQACEPRPLPGFDIVAEATPPIAGDDAVVEFFFRTDSPEHRPVVLEDGRVDFFNLNLIENVRRGVLLAQKTPATRGTPGSSVKGTPIPPKAGKEVPLLPGKNVVTGETTFDLHAGISGHAVLGKRNRVDVYPVYEIRGSVGLNTGNIDYLGTLVVRGGVETGLKVNARRDVEIGGCIESGSVEAGGNVLVRRGIQGRNKGSIRAEGSVLALFIENAQVWADGSVEVGEAIMHSHVIAGERVTVRGRRGLIVGGLVRAREEIVARTLGSPLGTPTEVEVGTDPALRDRLTSLKERLGEGQQQLEESTKAIRYLKDTGRMKESLEGPRREMVLKVLRFHGHLRRQVKEMIEDRQEIERLVQERARGRIKVSDRIYPGVKVTIGHATTTIRDELAGATLRLGEDGEIEIIGG